MPIQIAENGVFGYAKRALNLHARCSEPRRRVTETVSKYVLISSLW